MNENIKTVRVGDLQKGDRIRFPHGPDGPEVVYAINEIHKPGRGDCYVELGYPDGGRYRTAMHENERAELIWRAVPVMNASLLHRYGLPLSREPMETLRLLAEHANRLLTDTPEEVPGFVAMQLEAVADWLALVDETLVYSRPWIDVDRQCARVAREFTGRRP